MTRRIPEEKRLRSIVEARRQRWQARLCRQMHVESPAVDAGLEEASSSLRSSDDTSKSHPSLVPRYSALTTLTDDPLLVRRVREGESHLSPSRAKQMKQDVKTRIQSITPSTAILSKLSQGAWGLRPPSKDDHIQELLPMLEAAPPQPDEDDLQYNDTMTDGEEEKLPEPVQSFDRVRRSSGSSFRNLLRSRRPHLSSLRSSGGGEHSLLSRMMPLIASLNGNNAAGLPFMISSGEEGEGTEEDPQVSDTSNLANLVRMSHVLSLATEGAYDPQYYSDASMSDSEDPHEAVERDDDVEPIQEALDDVDLPLSTKREYDALRDPSFRNFDTDEKTTEKDEDDEELDADARMAEYDMEELEDLHGDPISFSDDHDSEVLDDMSSNDDLEREIVAQEENAIEAMLAAGSCMNGLCEIDEFMGDPLHHPTSNDNIYSYDESEISDEPSDRTYSIDSEPSDAADNGEYLYQEVLRELLICLDHRRRDVLIDTEEGDLIYEVPDSFDHYASISADLYASVFRPEGEPTSCQPQDRVQVEHPLRDVWLALKRQFPDSTILRLVELTVKHRHLTRPLETDPVAGSGVDMPLEPSTLTDRDSLISTEQPPIDIAEDASNETTTPSTAVRNRNAKRRGNRSDPSGRRRPLTLRESLYLELYNLIRLHL